MLFPLPDPGRLVATRPLDHVPAGGRMWQDRWLSETFKELGGRGWSPKVPRLGGHGRLLVSSPVAGVSGTGIPSLVPQAMRCTRRGKRAGGAELICTLCIDLASNKSIA